MVAASREFVCIRPQTYEDAAEAEVLSWVFADRDGTLRNTSFGILSSDGERKLSPSGRSPSMVYGTAERFVEALETLAGEARTQTKPAITALPELPDLRIALDVAAADLRPLVVLYTKDEGERQRLRERLGRAAWDDALIGRLRYVVLESEEQRTDFEELELEPGVTVIEAEPYGRGGVSLAHIDVDASQRRLTRFLATALARFDAPDKDVRSHLRQGAREGIRWSSEIPVSDPGRGR